MRPSGVIPIRRSQVLSYLMIAAFVAGLSAGCFDNPSEDISEVREISPNDALADRPVDAVFYENAEQCRQDIAQKQQEYQANQQAFKEDPPSQPPAMPTLKPEDCEAQLFLALKEHEGHAPVYQTLEQCQAEGVECTQATVNGGQTTQGYYPRFGGSFIYPYDPSPDFVYVNFGGTTHRVYRTTTVYQSSSGNLVTPYGRTVPPYSPGKRISVPQHTRFTAPSRPSGTTGSGIIRGRSSTGFGSTYKSTGRGGVGK